ncbi:MAG: hypothetical protein A2516_04855 [Alphaproteobacteria bacterium RIFOXYD12_FULL_60_8]|nr:MAG: hypothetical protein A2516_04855 [Alphaproteobacteria bacterium RIFOXYD12_FULL_60_8]
MAPRIKLPVILFGEGKSEQGYGRWLNRLAGTLDVPVAIRAEKLCGGDPLELVSSSLKKLKAIEQTRGRYSHKALLLDTDLKGQNPERDQQAENTAREKGLHLIWQDPDHESFLRQHFPVGKAKLEDVWPAYEKGLDALQYEKVLTRDHLNRARAIDPGLNDFLVAIGWD